MAGAIGSDTYLTGSKDSATWYYNEKECGEIIRDFLAETGIPRSEIFYTTKLMTNVSYEDTLKNIDKSIKACGLEYLDLYLLHSAIGGPEKRRECWRALCDAKKQGKIRSIGVSNFGIAHLQEMLDQGVELPSINQVPDDEPCSSCATEPSPRLGRLASFHDSHGDSCHVQEARYRLGSTFYRFQPEFAVITPLAQAWGPLVRGLRFGHPSITRLAEKYKKQPAQVLLRYSIQKVRNALVFLVRPAQPH